MFTDKSRRLGQMSRSMRIGSQNSDPSGSRTYAACAPGSTWHAAQASKLPAGSTAPLKHAPQRAATDSTT